MYSRYGARVDAVTAGLYADPAEVPPAAFLTAEEQARAAREWQTLDAIEAAPEFFGREALAWAATHPTDARWRKRCTAWCGRHVWDAPPTGVATCHAQAFTLLHKRFPRSEWAAQTPYWLPLIPALPVVAPSASRIRRPDPSGAS